MKRVTRLTAIVVLAAMLCGASAYGQCCGACPNAKMKALVGKALVLDLADKLGLAGEEMTILLDEFSKYQKELASLQSQRAETKDKLTAAVDSGAAESEISALLDKLQGLDEDIFQLKNDTIDAYAMDLTSEQMAACYLFLADYDQVVCAAVKVMRGDAAPCAAAAPGAAPCAAAAPAEAAAPAADGTPEEKALAAAKAWCEALVAQDMDKTMACFADDFEHYEYGDKSGIQDFIGQAVDMGYLEDLETSVEDAEAEVDGEEIIVYPVELSGAFGSVTFELVFQDRNGEMKITGLDASGL